jgi:hypothetical protein
VQEALDNGLAKDKQAAHDLVVDVFRDWLNDGVAPSRFKVSALAAKRRTILSRIDEIKDRNLACWCRADESCHADVLIELARKT